MIDSKKREKMHEFNEFGVTSPLHQARWHLRRVHRGVPARHGRGSEHGRRGTVIDEVSGRTPSQVDGFGMQQTRELGEKTLSASGNHRGKSLFGAPFEATRRDRAPLSPRSGMSVAKIIAMRVHEPSAQPGLEEAE